MQKKTQTIQTFLSEEQSKWQMTDVVMENQGEILFCFKF